MQVSTSVFTYNKQHRSFVTEASNFSRAGQEIFHRIYPDACDEGITLISHVTGLHADFYVHETGTDDEGDVTHWTLHPTPETVRKTPRLRGVYVRIFND